MLSITFSQSNIMLCDWFSVKGAGQFHCIVGLTDGTTYCKIENPLQSAKTMNMGHGWVSQGNKGVLSHVLLILLACKHAFIQSSSPFLFISRFSTHIFGPREEASIARNIVIKQHV